MGTTFSVREGAGGCTSIQEMHTEEDGPSKERLGIKGAH